MTLSGRGSRRGVTLVEVIIVVAILLVVLIFVLMALPRSRETARMASCSRNLMFIGKAVIYTDGALNHLPTVPPLNDKTGEPPLPAMLGQLGLGDFQPLAEEKGKAGRSFHPGAAPTERLIRSFVCPSDANGFSGRFPAPLSYRANTGDTPDGLGGPFAPGVVVSLADVTASDGVDYTAGFAERLVGSGGKDVSPRNDYLRVPGPVGSSPCPSVTDPFALQPDAGSSWAKNGWISTLYNHALVPNDEPSCIAEDGRTARMGASSNHEKTVYVLMLGGSVRAVSPSIDSNVWRKMGTISDLPQPSP